MLGGDISYGLIDPMKQSVVMFSGGFGPGASGFADFARWLTDDQSAGISPPVFINNAYDQVTQWEVYRKLNISIEAPAADFVDSVLDSQYGNNFEMLNTLKGLKIDLAVSMGGHGKGSLDKDLVRQFVKKKCLRRISQGSSRFQVKTLTNSPRKSMISTVPSLSIRQK